MERLGLSETVRDGRTRPSETVRDEEAGTIRYRGRWRGWDHQRSWEMERLGPSEIVRDGRARPS